MVEKVPVDQRPIKFITKDRESILVSRKLLQESGTIRDMLDTCCADDKESSFIGPVEIPIETQAMRMIIRWCESHPNDDIDSVAEASDNHSSSSEDFLSQTAVGEGFVLADKKFFTSMEHATLFKVINAANYLNMPVLLDLASKYVASLIIGKDADEVRKYFKVQSDFLCTSA